MAPQPGNASPESEPAAEPTRRGPTQRQWLWSATAVIVVAVVVFVLVRTEPWDNRPRVPVGKAVATSLNTVHGTTAKVSVPWGSFRLTIGEPQEELPEFIRDKKRAPEDGSFVGLSLKMGTMQSLLPMPFTKGGKYGTPQVTLVADGKRYPVPELTEPIVLSGNRLRVEFTANYFLAVSGEPETISIEVTYDGETQTVDASGDVAAGRFAALQDVTRTAKKRSCGTPHVPPEVTIEDGPLKCRLTSVGRFPYVAGLGWAEPGHEWLAVATEFEIPWEISYPEAPPEPISIDTDQLETSYSLGNGREPAAKADANAVGPGLKLASANHPDVVVFAVPENVTDPALHVTGRFRTHEEHLGYEFPVTWDVELR